MAQVMAALPMAEVTPPQMSEILKSSALNVSEKNFEESKPKMPALCRSLPTESPEFRKSLFRLDEGHHPKVKTLAITGERYVRKIAHNDFKTGRDLVLSGPPGSGKTHVARAIYDYVQAFGVDICFKHGGRHPSPIWIDWPNVAEADDQSDFLEICYRLETSRLIIFDDIGSETDRFKTGIPTSRLRRVLSLIEGCWAVVTTNFTKEEFFDAYDARTIDRLRAFKWLSLEGVPSYRTKLGRQAVTA